MNLMRISTKSKGSYSILAEILIEYKYRKTNVQ